MREIKDTENRRPLPDAEADGIIEGRNAVIEALRTETAIDKIYIAKGETDKTLGHIASKARAAGIVVVDADRRKLDAMSRTHAHQGVIALAAVREYATVEQILQSAADRGEAPLLVVCDEISDPHNLGAILRTAECAGAHGVIIPKRRSAGLTAIVAKTSAGAVSYIPVARVPNIPALLKDLKKQGVWVFGTAADGNTTLYNADLKGPAAIVIGSEIDCALVQKLRREVNPFEPVSVSIGSFQTFGRYNVVCDRAVLDGTVRTTSEESRNYLHRRIREIPQQIASLYGGQAKVDIQAGYGVLRNSPELFQRFSTHAARLLGQEHVHTDIHPSLIGEDFYYFSHQVPSLYFHIGCQAEHPLHNDAFLPREEVLGVAIDLMTDYFLAQA